MAFSDAAIGFYLQMEDQLTPQLPGATRAYEKFIKTLTKLNRQGFDQVSGFLGTLGGLVKSVEKLTAGSTVELNIGLTRKSRKAFGDVIGEAVTNALSKSKLRLSASVPKRLLKMFSQDATLRTLYRDLPQPPDMVGGFQVPKYAEGGKVKRQKKGPNFEDTVFGLLTPGEVVVPAKLVNKLETAVEFLDSAKKTLSAGLGSDKDLKDYQQGLTVAAEAMERLHEATKAAGFATAQKLQPQLSQLRQRFEDLNEQVEKKNVPTFKALFQKILGPVNFLAVNEGVKRLQDGLSQLRGGADKAYQALGGGKEIDDGIDALNRANVFLGRSRDSLAQLKFEVAGIASEYKSITFDDLAVGFLEAKQQGISAKETALELATAAKLAERALGLSSDSVTSFGFQARGVLMQTNEEFGNFLAGLGRLSDESSGLDTTASKLFSDTQSNLETLRATLAQFNKKDATNTIQTLNRLGASLDSAFVDGSKFREIFSQAIAGDDDAINKSIQLTGLNITELTDRFKRGDLTGLLDRIAENAREVKQQGPLAFERFAKTVDLSSRDLEQLASQQDVINQNFARSGELLRNNTAGLAELDAKGAATYTTFELLQKQFVDAVGTFQVFGVSGLEVLNFLKEFQFTSLIAATSIGGVLSNAVGGLTKGLFGLAKQAATTQVTLGGMAQGAPRLASSLGAVAAKLGIVGAGIAVTGASLAYQENLKADIEESKTNLEEMGRFGKIGDRLRRAQFELRELDKIGKAQGARKGTASFLSDSQREKATRLRAEIEDLQMQARAARATVSPPSEAGVKPAEVQALMRQVVESGQTDMTKTNELLGKLVGLIQKQTTTAGEKPATSSPAAPTSNFGSLTTLLSNFGI